MKIALDTNVLSYFLYASDNLSLKAQQAMGLARDQAELVVCPAVYAELAAMDGFDVDEFAQTLKDIEVSVDWTPLEPALWLRAGLLYGQYARSPKPKKGSDRRILADFLILAHFEARADLLLTFDNALVQVAADPRVVYAPDWKSA